MFAGPTIEDSQSGTYRQVESVIEERSPVLRGQRCNEVKSNANYFDSQGCFRFSSRSP